jgi:hypothetical protein
MMAKEKCRKLLKEIRMNLLIYYLILAMDIKHQLKYKVLKK